MVAEAWLRKKNAVGSFNSMGLNQEEVAKAVFRAPLYVSQNFPHFFFCFTRSLTVLITRLEIETKAL
jgi:hypothetical protein